MVATAAEYGVDKTKDQNKEKPMVEENTKEEKKRCRNLLTGKSSIKYNTERKKSFETNNNINNEDLNLYKET